MSSNFFKKKAVYEKGAERSWGRVRICIYRHACAWSCECARPFLKMTFIFWKNKTVFKIKKIFLFFFKIHTARTAFSYYIYKVYSNKYRYHKWYLPSPTQDSIQIESHCAQNIRQMKAFSPFLTFFSSIYKYRELCTRIDQYSEGHFCNSFL